MSDKVRDRLSGLAWVLAIFVAIAVVWEAAVKFFNVPLFILPPIEDVITEFFSSPALFLRNAAFTVATAMGGFAIAVIVGILLSVMIVSSRLLERIFMTLLAVIHSIPKVALAPLFVIWLGTGFEPKLAIAAMMAVLVVVVDTVAGMRSVDPEMLSLARVTHASPLAILLKIRFPAALPQIFAAMKAAISLSVVGAIVGEFVGATQGLGYLIIVSSAHLETPTVFAAITAAAAAGITFFYIIGSIERAVVFWQSESVE